MVKTIQHLNNKLWVSYKDIKTSIILSCIIIIFCTLGYIGNQLTQTHNLFAQTSTSSQYKVKVFYFYPSDKPAPDDRRLNTTRIMIRDIQEWYMANVGKTFDLVDGYPTVVKGAKTASNYLNGTGIIDEVIPPSSRDPNLNFVIIIQNDNNPSTSLWHGGPFNGVLSYTNTSNNGVAVVDTQDSLEVYLADPSYGGSGICPNGVPFGRNGTGDNWWKSCKPPKAMGGVAHEIAHSFGLSHPGSCITETCEKGKPGRDFLAQCIPQSGATSCDSRTVFFSGLQENIDYKIVFEHRKSDGSLWVNDFICLTQTCDNRLVGKVVKVDFHQSAACNLYNIYNRTEGCHSTILDAGGIGQVCIQRYSSMCEANPPMPGASFMNITSGQPYTPEVQALRNNRWLWRTSSSGQCTKKSQGDTNCDGNIDETDRTIWRGEYTSQNGRTSDFNNDGKVSILDFSVWANTKRGVTLVTLPPTVTPTVLPPTNPPLTPSISSPTTNIFGKSMKLSGSNYTYAAAAISNTHMKTVEGWVKPQSTSTPMIIFSAVSNSSTCKAGYTLSVEPIQPTNLDGGQRLRLSVTDITGAQTDKTATLSLPNTWSHIAFTIDPTTRKFRLFSNGNATTEQLLPQEYCTAATKFIIGSNNGTGNFRGEIDEVRLSNIIRYTQSYNVNSVKTPFQPISNVNALYHFEGNALDTTVNYNHMKPFGTVEYTTSTVPSN